MANTVDLCTIADVQLRFSTNDNPAGIIQAGITAASRKINSRYDRELTPQTAGATRTFRVNSNVVDLYPFDLRAVNGAGVVLDPAGSPVSLAATDYRLTPRGTSGTGTYLGIQLSNFLALISGTSLAFGFAELAITGDWGCYTTATVPEDIRDACVETVGSWVDRAVAQYANAPTGGEDPQARPDRFAGYGIPPSAHSVLCEYRRATFR